jgi:hypothetical protein
MIDIVHRDGRSKMAKKKREETISHHHLLGKDTVHACDDNKRVNITKNE